MDSYLEFCEKAGIREAELKGGGEKRKVSGMRGEIAYYLSRDVEVSMAEIGRQVGVCASAVAKAIEKRETVKRWLVS